jgi:hypothetical protein
VEESGLKGSNPARLKIKIDFAVVHYIGKMML